MEGTMSKHVRIYTACRDCKKCTNSDLANLGRDTARTVAGVTTLGISEIGFAARKKCHQCGHQLSLHYGAQATTAQPAVGIQTINYPAGWYPDPTTPQVMRWWDGQAWTDHTIDNPQQQGGGSVGSAWSGNYNVNTAPSIPGSPQYYSSGQPIQPSRPLERPSYLPTVLISLFFSAFGLIPALRHSKMAKERGYSQRGYWWAFGLLVAVLPIIGAATPPSRSTSSQVSSASQNEQAAPVHKTPPVVTTSPPSTVVHHVPSFGTWTAGQSIALSYIVCPATAFCVGVNNWDAYTYTSGKWSGYLRVVRYGGLFDSLRAVSCPSSNFCMAIDTNGATYLDQNGTWSASMARYNLQAISCPVNNYCITVSDGNAYFYNGALANDTTSLNTILGWSISPEPINTNGSLTSVSCPTTQFCMAVDNNGYAFTYSNGAWSPGQQIDDNSYIASLQISCPTTQFCMAVDNNGYAIPWNGSKWLVPQSVGSDLTSVSCPTTQFCIASGSSRTYIFSRQ